MHYLVAIKLYICFLKTLPKFYDKRRVVQSSNVQSLSTYWAMWSKKYGRNFWAAGRKGVAYLQGSACDVCGGEGRRGLQNGWSLWPTYPQTQTALFSTSYSTVYKMWFIGYDGVIISLKPNNLSILDFAVMIHYPCCTHFIEQWHHQLRGLAATSVSRKILNKYIFRKLLWRSIRNFAFMIHCPYSM